MHKTFYPVHISLRHLCKHQTSQLLKVNLVSPSEEPKPQNDFVEGSLEGFLDNESGIKLGKDEVS